MRPVNLIPADVVVKTASGTPNLGMIGGAAVGLIAIVGVAGYFAMARVDSVKSETKLAIARQEQATSRTAAIESQVQTLGTPVVDSDQQLAQGAESVLVSAYSERHDFVMLADELREIMVAGGWYEEIEATSAADGESKAVKIVAVFPTKELAASFNERARATRTLANADTVAIESRRLTDLDSRRPGIYFEITLEADLVDTVAPSASGGADTGDGTGTTVGAGGGGTLSLSLDSEPRDTPKATKPATPAKPKNPFDLAATVASRGGAS